MTHHNVFDSALVSANRWLDELSTTLELAPNDRPRALHALRAGLHAIRDRLPAGEVVALAAQFPTLIRGLYFEGWTLRNNQPRIRNRAEMLAHVRREMGTEKKLDPVDVLRGVIKLLVEHVSPGEVRDVLSTLPRSIVSLWQELAGHAVETLDTTHPTRANTVRHTGYSR